MEGIGLIEKKSKNSIQWLGGGPGSNSREVTDKLLTLKDELIDLDYKEMELDRHLAWSRQSVVNMIDEQISCNQKQYMYVTHDELCQIFTSNKNSIVIQSPPDTKLTIETIMKSDLLYYEDVFDDNECENLDDINILAHRTDYIKSLKQIKMLRKRGRCNQIHLKSYNGPTNVMIVNQDFDQDFKDNLQHCENQQLNQLAPYKRKKYFHLKRLIDSQRLEANQSSFFLDSSILGHKILEETGLILDEIKPSELCDITPQMPAATKTNNSAKKKTISKTNRTKSEVKKRKEKEVAKLPSRHLSPRRAAQQHLFCRTSRTFKELAQQSSNIMTRGKKERKNICSTTENILPAVDDDTTNDPDKTEELTKNDFTMALEEIQNNDEDSNNNENSNDKHLNEKFGEDENSMILQPVEIFTSKNTAGLMKPFNVTNIEQTATDEIKNNFCIEEKETEKQLAEMDIDFKDLAETTEISKTIVPTTRQPFSQVQIKLDIDDLIIPDVYLPFLRLSPPTSNQDYHFNLSKDEGILDLFLTD